MKRAEAEDKLMERIEVLKMFRGNGEKVMEKLKLLESLPP